MVWLKRILGLMILAGLILAGYFKIYLPKTTYLATPVQTGTLQATVFGIGEVSAKNIYPVTSSSGGKILTILTDEGQWVKKGQTLAQMDAVDLPDLLNQAKANLKKAEYDVVALEKTVTSLKAQLTLSKLDNKRNQTLLKKGYSAQQAYDTTFAQTSEIKANIAANQARIKSAKAQVGVQLANINALNHKLERLTLFSPIDGYVISRPAEVAQTISPTQPILQIVDPKTVWIKTHIDERLTSNIKIGQVARIILRSQPKQVLKGKVLRLSAITDPVTHEREVDVAFNHLPIPIYINSQASVTILTQTFSQVTLIPSTWITYYQGQAGVWTHTTAPYKAHFQKIEILGRNDQTIATHSLSSGTPVLRPNPQNKPLKEGMTIHLKITHSHASQQD